MRPRRLDTAVQEPLSKTAIEVKVDRGRTAEADSRLRLRRSSGVRFRKIYGFCAESVVHAYFLRVATEKDAFEEDTTSPRRTSASCAQPSGTVGSQVFFLFFRVFVFMIKGDGVKFVVIR